MKRSEINREIESALAFFEKMNFKLPRWGYWSPEQWRNNRGDATEVFSNHLGWDLTDFGLGDFRKTGLILFTIRNGNPARDKKTYCEKIMISGENQVTPTHYHYHKMEDIINRGGGTLVIELFSSQDSGEQAGSSLSVMIDGMKVEVPEDRKIMLVPGQSITLPPGLYHKFYALEGSGRVLIGEVSAVNDDENDNHFRDEVGRFPTIEEDESIQYLLISDYENIR